MPTTTTQRRILPAVGELLSIAPQHASGAAPWVAQVTAVRGRSIEITPVAADGVPISNRNPSFQSGQVEAAFVRATAMHRFSANLAANPRGYSRSADATFLLSIPHHVERVQRRRDYRLPLSVGSRAWLTNGGRAMPVWLMNLSAGGALISSPCGFKSGAVISIEVPTGLEGDPAYVRAVVIDSRQERLSSRYRNGDEYSVRLSFDDGGSIRLTDLEREAIVRYIFEQQRVLLRVRKLMGDGTPAAMPSKKKTRTLAELLAWLRAPSK